MVMLLFYFVAYSRSLNQSLFCPVADILGVKLLYQSKSIVYIYSFQLKFLHWERLHHGAPKFTQTFNLELLGYKLPKLVA